MGAGLQPQNIPIFVEGGLNTKLDPRLVPAGSLVELENMYQLKTGELRLRNGFTATNISSAFSGASATILSCFRGPGDTIGVIARQGGALGHIIAVTIPLPFSISGGGAIGTAQIDPFPGLSPVVRSISNVPGSGTTFPDLVDPDVAIASGLQMNCWTDVGGISNTRFCVTDTAGTTTGLGPNQSPGWTIPFASRGKCAAGGSSYLSFFAIDNAGTPSLRAYTVQSNGAVVSTNQLVALTSVSAAQPWFDVKPIPGTNNIAVAYRASAGGVTCLIFNPATGAVTSTVTTAGADASMTMGWLDDQLSTGSMLLGTAGSGSGVVVRTMSATTMTVSATLTIDAAATANVRNITGHTWTSAADYLVLWDVTATPTYNTLTRKGVVTAGVAGAAADCMRSVGLSSRSFRLASEDYVLLAYESPNQSTFFLCNVRNPDGLCSSVSAFMSGYAGKRRVRVATLSSVVVSGSTATVAVSKQTQVIANNGVFVPARSVYNASFSVPQTPWRPQEIGGMFLIPGGWLLQQASGVQDPACHSIYPEATVSLTPTSTGSMTPSATYSYVQVYGFTEPGGRIIRSAPSVPESVTLGPGNNSVDIQYSFPRILNGRVAVTSQRAKFVEFYRAGPAAAGATNYNRVGTAITVATNFDDSTSGSPFVDTMSDVNANTGELLYTTGNVLENLPPPPGNIFTVNGNRGWVVNSEDPNELHVSKEVKAGVGIAFNGRQKIRLDGESNNGVLALAAMDGRVIAFKSSAIYVISGDGPNDLGQGSFNPPQAVSLSIGTSIPGSVVATPDGIMFQSKNGIYLLDRGLGLSYVGAPVEQYTLAANVVDASPVDGVTQVRFVMASGRCLVWDYHHKRWSTFLLRVDSGGVASTIVGCANVPGGWCYALADGTIMQETPGVYSDINGTTTAIVPRIGFPHLSMGGINGYARLYGVEILGEYVGAHTLAVDYEYDYSGSVTETRSKVISAGPFFQYEALSATQKASSVKITLRTSAQAAGSGAFRLSGLTLMVGVKRGSGIANTKRLT